MSIKHIQIELLVHEQDLDRIVKILNTEFLHYGLSMRIEGDKAVWQDE